MLNISTTLPEFGANLETTDFQIFFDVANVWGVDYDFIKTYNNFLYYFIFYFQKINAEQIRIYINMEKIMKASKAGKQIMNKIAKSNEKKFKQI